MKIIFGRNKHWISYVIRLRTLSNWSHVAVIDGDRVIEAQGKVGVRYTKLSKFLKRYDVTEVREIDGDIERVREMIGRPFDMSALWGILFFQNWQNPEHWFCSELVAYACPFFHNDYAHKATPELIYWLSRPLTRENK